MLFQQRDQVRDSSDSDRNDPTRIGTVSRPLYRGSSDEVTWEEIPWSFHLSEIPAKPEGDKNGPSPKVPHEILSWGIHPPR